MHEIGSAFLFEFCRRDREDDGRGCSWPRPPANSAFSTLPPSLLAEQWHSKPSTNEWLRNLPPTPQDQLPLLLLQVLSFLLLVEVEQQVEEEERVLR